MTKFTEATDQEFEEIEIAANRAFAQGGWKHFSRHLVDAAKRRFSTVMPDDTAGLIDRLLHQTVAIAWPLRKEAAAAITALTAEREALRARVEALSGWHLAMNGHGEPDGTYSSVPIPDEPDREKYVRLRDVLALLEKPAAQQRAPEHDYQASQ